MVISVTGRPTPWRPAPRQPDSCETGGVIGQTIGNDQFAVVEQSAACVNDVRYIAFTLVLVWLEQGFPQAADDLGRVIAIEQESADAVLSQRADTVTENQPSGSGLDRRSTVTQLDQFPRKGRFKEQLALIPEVNVVGRTSGRCFSLSWRESMTYRPPIFRGNRASLCSPRPDHSRF